MKPTYFSDLYVFERNILDDSLYEISIYFWKSNFSKTTYPHYSHRPQLKLLTHLVLY